MPVTRCTWRPWYVQPAGPGGHVRLAGSDSIAVDRPGPFSLDGPVERGVGRLPVGGPSDVVVRASISDPLGFIHTGRT